MDEREELAELRQSVKSLVDSTKKLESTTENINEAIQILARSQVTIEHHSEQISAISKKVDNLEKRERVIEDALHVKCETHKDNITTKYDKEVKDIYIKVDDEIDKQDGKGMKRFLLSLGILSVVFGYMYLDLNSAKDTSEKQYNIIITKLDELKKDVADIKTKELVNASEIQHVKDSSEKREKSVDSKLNELSNHTNRNYGFIQGKKQPKGGYYGTKE